MKVDRGASRGRLLPHMHLERGHRRRVVCARACWEGWGEGKSSLSAYVHFERSRSDKSIPSSL